MGGGGRAMAQLIDDVFAAALGNPYLDQKNDQAVIDLPEALSQKKGRLILSTDSFVISPLFFPGGDIGSLAVHGTVNDLAMSGGTPLYLTAGFILEEGFPLADLQKIVHSMAQAAEEAGVQIVTGDTKVVEKGKGDGLFINTAGVGVVPQTLSLSGDKLQVGDAVLINGTIGDHGISILSQRDALGFETEIKSDSSALNGLIADMIESAPDIHCLRDPTRGGVAATLNEVAQQSGVGIVLQEKALPLKSAVIGACELLGIDPLHSANEGKVLAFCPAAQAEALLACMRQHPLGQEAALIGHVIDDPHHFVQMETSFGGRRIVDWLVGEQLPRIC